MRWRTQKEMSLKSRAELLSKRPFFLKSFPRDHLRPPARLFPSEKHLKASEHSTSSGPPRFERKTPQKRPLGPNVPL